jgi:hypothetical protein
VVSATAALADGTSTGSRTDGAGAVKTLRLMRHKAWQALALLTATVVLTSCGHWRGIANMPLPGGPGSGKGSYTI